MLGVAWEDVELVKEGEEFLKASILKHNNYSEFGKLVSKLAEKNGVRSGVDISNAMGLSKTEGHRILNGGTVPTPELVELILTTFPESTEKERRTIYNAALRLSGWKDLKALL